MKNITYIESTVKMPLLKLPVRTNVVTLKNGKVLISPGSKLSKDELSQFTGITDIVAPNLLHCAGVALASKVFPEARIWGPPGAAKQKPEIKWGFVLNKENWIYSQELPLVPIKGIPILNEIVFFETESRTLIVCDLAFNLLRSKGIGAWIITHLFGTYHRLGVSRLVTKAIKDRSAFIQSIQEIFVWDFENLLVAHGDPVLGDGKAKLAKAFADRGIKVPVGEIV